MLYAERERDTHAAPMIYNCRGNHHKMHLSKYYAKFVPCFVVGSLQLVTTIKNLRQRENLLRKKIADRLRNIKKSERKKNER